MTTSKVDAFGRSIAPIAKELDVSLTEVIPMDDDLESVFRYLIEGS
jgi:ABC-2 type transport system ATP-binding protein